MAKERMTVTNKNMSRFNITHSIWKSVGFWLTCRIRTISINSEQTSRTLCISFRNDKFRTITENKAITYLLLWTCTHMKHSTMVMKMLDPSPGWLFPMFQATQRTQESVDCEQKVYAAPTEACTHMKHSTMVMKRVDPSPGWSFPMFQATDRTQEFVDCERKVHAALNEACTHMIHSTMVMKIVDPSPGWSFPMFQATDRTQESVDCERKVHAAPNEASTHMKHSTMVMKMLDPSPGWSFPMFQATQKTQESVDCELRCERCMQYWHIFSSLVTKSLVQLGIICRNQIPSYANTYVSHILLF